MLTWDPPQSPLRIEYSSALLGEVRAAGERVDAFGPLFGVRRGKTIRLLATHGEAGMEPLGAFASRLHGGVCLTEDDLRRFDKVPAMVVISGESAGFFLRDMTGTIGTVCNYREVAVPVDAGPAAGKSGRPWVQIAVSVVLSVAVGLLGIFSRGKPQVQPGGNLREDRGQLTISWKAADSAGAVEILDGGERVSVTTVPWQSSLTYVRRSGDVTVAVGTERFRFIGPTPARAAGNRAGGVEERRRVEALESKVAELRAGLASGEVKLGKLESRARYLTPH